MFRYGDRANVEDLEGEVFTSVENHDDEKITFETEGREIYRMYHRQGCCERVRVEEIDGALSYLHDQKIQSVKKETWESENPSDAPTEGNEWGSFTWTYFTFRTAERVVTIKWLGESNGYYYEGVDIARMVEDTEEM